MSCFFFRQREAWESQSCEKTAGYNTVIQHQQTGGGGGWGGGGGGEYEPAAQ